MMLHHRSYSRWRAMQAAKRAVKWAHRAARSDDLTRSLFAGVAVRRDSRRSLSDKSSLRSTSASRKTNIKESPWGRVRVKLLSSHKLLSRTTRARGENSIMSKPAQTIGSFSRNLTPLRKYSKSLCCKQHLLMQRIWSSNRLRSWRLKDIQVQDNKRRAAKRLWLNLDRF